MTNVSSLQDTGQDPGADIYYRSDFRDMIETHLTYLLEDEGAESKIVDPQVAVRHEYDFLGLLSEMRIKPQYHWIVMRMNGLTNPTNYTSDMVNLIIPSTATIDRLRRMHTTVHSIR